MVRKVLLQGGPSLKGMYIQDKMGAHEETRRLYGRGPTVIQRDLLDNKTS